MFSEYYSSFDKKVKKIISSTKIPNSYETKEILKKSLERNLLLEDSAKLLKIGKSENTEEQFNLVKNFVYLNFRNEENSVNHIAPIYLSSFCIDRCGYCNFSFANKNTQRKRIELSELGKELEEVINSGNNVIEFTLATDPKLSPKILSEYVSKAKNLLSDKEGSGILLCSDHFSEESYRLLKDSGLWGMVQWDETLDEEKYKFWHGRSPRKQRFQERINNHDRAIKAGLQIATGNLFGLSDYMYDVLMQIGKARYLENEYGKKPFVFGTPRIRKIGGTNLYSSDELNDRIYELSLMVYKISEPEIGRWLQTRESPELNLRNVVNNDFYTYKCGDVKPGGYKINKNNLDTKTGGQFSVNEMTKNKFEKELKKINFKPNYSWVK